MSNFGEICEPSSRTVWEDWDDDVVHQETFPNLQFKRKTEVPAKIENFLILEGRYFYDCVKEQLEFEHVNSIAEVNLHVYKIKESNNYICVIKDYNLIQSSEILELLKEFVIKSENVVGVLTKPIIEYQVAQLVTTDIVIRSICTSETKSSYPSLEQPNIVAGVAAGALCLREIIDKPANILVCYIEHPEEQQIQELQELLDNLKIIPHMGKVKRNSILNSNLYI